MKKSKDSLLQTKPIELSHFEKSTDENNKVQIKIKIQCTKCSYKTGSQKRLEKSSSEEAL